jgi:ribonuclease HI/exonuclease III
MRGGLDEKRLGVSEMAAERKPHFIGLAETNVRPKWHGIWKNRFGDYTVHQIAHESKNSHKTGAGYGLMLLIHKSVAAKFTVTWRDPEGRALAVTGQWNSRTTVEMVLVHAPCGDTDQRKFWKRVAERTNRTRRAGHKKLSIIIGDVNAVARTRDRDNASEHARPSIPYMEFLSSNDLQDAHRAIHGTQQGFTRFEDRQVPHTGRIKTVQSRIDVALIKKKFKTKLTSLDVDHAHQHTSDHCPIHLALKIRSGEWVPQARYKPPRIRYNSDNSGKFRDLLPGLEAEIPELAESPTTEQIEHFSSEYMRVLMNRASEAYGRPTDRKMVKNPDYCKLFTHDGELLERTKEQKQINKVRHTVAALMRGRPVPERKLDKVVQYLENHDSPIPPSLTRVTDALRFDNGQVTPTDIDWIQRELREDVIDPLHEARKQNKRRISRRAKALNIKMIQNAIDALMRNEYLDPHRFFQNLKKEYREDASIDGVYETERQGEDLLVNKTVESYEPESIAKSTAQFTSWLFRETVAAPQQLPEWLRPKLSPIDNEFVTRPISGDEVREIIKNMKKGTAPGPDGIPVDIFNQLSVPLTDKMARLFNTCMEKGHIPKDWKNAYIRLIPKAGDQRDLRDYRPISLLSCIYKIYTTILEKRIRFMVESTKQISDLQAGFRQGKGCYTNLNTLINVFEDANQFQNNIHCVYVDLKKAFDTVPHWGLVRALRFFHTPEVLVRAVQSLYDNITTQVILKHGLSDKTKVLRGIRQGDSLSPLLFILLFDTFLQRVKASGKGYKFARNPNLTIPALAYADDLVLLANSKEEIDQLWAMFIEFCNCMGLEVNAGKSAYTTNDEFSQNIKTANGEMLPLLEHHQTYKYLGIHINLDLTFHEEISSQVLRAKKMVNAIRYRKLTLNQCITFINKVIYGGLSYRMAFIKFPKDKLQEIDDSIESCMRQWLRIPSIVKTDRLYCSTQNAGLDLHEAFNHQAAAFVSTYFCFRLNGDTNSVSYLSTQQRTRDQPGLRTFVNTTRWEVKRPKDKTSLRTFVSYLMDLDWSTEAAIHDKSNLAERLSDPDLLMKLFSMGIHDVSQLTSPDRKTLSVPPTVRQALSATAFKALHTALMPPGSDVRQTKTNLTRGEVQSKRKPEPIRPVLSHPAHYSWDPRIQHSQTIVCWTDGSSTGDRKKGAYGVFFADGSPHNAHGRNMYAEDNFTAELEAIKVAIQLCPLKYNLLIFTDSKSAIDAVNTFAGKCEKNKWRVPNRYLLDHIWSDIKEKAKNKATVQFRYVPSHVDDKMKEYAQNDATKLRELNTTLRNLETDFPGWKDVIIHGNEQADELAKTGLSKDKPKENFPIKEGYVLRKQEGLFADHQVHSQLKRHLRNRDYSEWYKGATGKYTRNINWDDIDEHGTNGIFKKALGGKQSEKKQKLDPVVRWAVRVFTNQVPTASVQHRRAQQAEDPQEAPPATRPKKKPNAVKKKWSPSQKHKNTYQTHDCPMYNCGKKENLFHILAECPEYAPQRQELLSEMEEKVRKHTRRNIPLPPFFAGAPTTQTFLDWKQNAPDSCRETLDKLENEHVDKKFLSNIGCLPRALRTFIAEATGKQEKLLSRLMSRLNILVHSKMYHIWNQRCRTFFTKKKTQSPTASQAAQPPSP